MAKARENLKPKNAASTSFDFSQGRSAGRKNQGSAYPPRVKPKSEQEILVGGCREACGDPKNAFRNFIRTLFGVSEGNGGPALVTFIDSTCLVDNRKELGKKWANMWLDGKLDERRESIAAWVEAYQRRCGTVAGGSSVEDALEAGMTFRRISSTEVEVEFVPPYRVGATNSENWTFRLGQRGLEWLVKTIYD